MPLYFAYGSNMDEIAMAQRCSKSTVIGPAILHRHRIAMMAEGYVTVVRDPRAKVYGLLWDVALSDVRALDRYENVQTGLYSKILQPVKRMDGEGVRPLQQALVYVGSNDAGGAAQAGYLEMIVNDAARLGFPAGYVAELEKLARSGQSGRKERTSSPANRRSASRALPGGPQRDSDGRIKVRPRHATPFDR